MAKHNLLTQEQFIFRANKIHNFKYDYSMVVYVKGKENVSILCPIHGQFQQKPNSHLVKRGCTSCGLILKSKKNNNEPG